MKELTIGDCRHIFCNTCKGYTRHELKCLESAVQNEDVDEETNQLIYWEEHQYRLWICRGCDTATFEIAYNIAGEPDDKGNKVWNSLAYYPKRQKSDWPLRHFYELNKRLTQIHREVIQSFNSDSRILCAIGLRALVEGVCADKGVIGGTLEKKIEGLKQLLPSNIVESLHSFRFIGNEAAHELQAPMREDLQLAIEVIEDLLNFLYELDYKARMLPRKKAQQADKKS